MTSDDDQSDPDQSRAGDPPPQGVLIRAENGDVVRYDETGLLLRLSDKVIADIARRIGPGLPASGQASPAHAAPPGQGAAPSDGPAPVSATPEIAALLEGTDYWNLREDGDWLRFDARRPGRQGARAFLCPREGGAIIADTPGPVLGLLAIGGARIALGSPGPGDFPAHVLSPADGIGSVGMSGEEPAPPRDLLEPLLEMTHEAEVAEALLNRALDAYAPLPLFVVRAETDRAESPASLAAGMAFDNLMRAAENLRAAARRLGKDARIPAVFIDFTLEDTVSDAAAYRDGMIALMDRITEGLFTRGFPAPAFLARFEPGPGGLWSDAVLEGQWQLAWNHADHRFVQTAPGYMFETDAYGRATPDSRRQMAEIAAAALTDLSGREAWRCPVFHLAEQTGAEIRVTAQAAGALALDARLTDDPAAGFALTGDEAGARILSVARDRQDELALIVTCDRPPRGAALRLVYAGLAEQPRGAVRDANWTLASATGATLHRWALPALLPVRPAGLAPAAAPILDAMEDEDDD